MKKISHLSHGDDAAEQPHEAKELLLVVELDRVLEADEGDAVQEGAAQGQHVADHARLAWKKSLFLSRNLHLFYY